MHTSELPSRIFLVERARAESQAIEQVNQLSRVEAEVQALAVIRSRRLAQTSKGIRNRMTVLATAAGLVCGVGGYWLGDHFSQNGSTTQLHVIEREVGAPYSNPDYGQPSVSIDQTTQAPVAAPALKLVVASAAAPIPVPVPVPVPMPPPLAANTSRMAAQAPAHVGAQPVRPRVAEAARSGATTHPANPPADRPAEAVEVTLPVKPQAAEARPTSSPPPALGKEYKVVNVSEGVVIVRQGHMVRPIRIGEKMPDGQTLKSVNTDKGQFETLP